MGAPFELHGVVAGSNIEQGKRWAFKLDMIMSALTGHSPESIIIICDVDTNFLHPSVAQSLHYYMESGKGLDIVFQRNDDWTLEVASSNVGIHLVMHLLRHATPRHAMPRSLGRLILIADPTSCRFLSNSCVKANIGFMAMRCNEQVLKLWETTRRIVAMSQEGSKEIPPIKVMACYEALLALCPTHGYLKS